MSAPELLRAKEEEAQALRNLVVARDTRIRRLENRIDELLDEEVRDVDPESNPIPYWFLIAMVVGLALIGVTYLTGAFG